MNTLDAGLFALVAVSTVWGMWRGMFRSVYGLAACFVAFWMAKVYGPEVFLGLVPIGKPVGSPPFLLASAYMLVFVGVLIPLMLLSLLLQEMIRKLNLGGFDKAAGFLFGLARGFLFAFIGVVMISFVPFVSKKMMGESAFLPAAGGALQVALNTPYFVQYKRYWYFDNTGAPIFDAKKLAEDAVLKNYLPDIDKDTESTTGDG